MTGNKTDKTKLSPVNIKEREELNFRAGDTVRVWSKILDEKGKTRLQAFEGVVLARKHGKEIGATFTVRKIASGIGVERIFPLFSPTVDKIEIIKKSRARKSKLYYIRTKTVKDIRKKLRSMTLINNKKIKTKAKTETETEDVDVKKEMETETEKTDTNTDVKVEKEIKVAEIKPEEKKKVEESESEKTEKKEETKIEVETKAEVKETKTEKEK